VDGVAVPKYRMPTNLHGYQRVIIRGIPAWKKGNGLYYYEQDVATNPLQIGTVSEGFATNVDELCSERIAAFRRTIEVRNRASAAPPNKK
jgi:hypothetical protein